MRFLEILRALNNIAKYKSLSLNAKITVKTKDDVVWQINSVNYVAEEGTDSVLGVVLIIE